MHKIILAALLIAASGSALAQHSGSDGDWKQTSTVTTTSAQGEALTTIEYIVPNSVQRYANGRVGVNMMVRYLVNGHLDSYEVGAAEFDCETNKSGFDDLVLFNPNGTPQVFTRGEIVTWDHSGRLSDRDMYESTGAALLTPLTVCRLAKR